MIYVTIGPNGSIMKYIHTYIHEIVRPSNRLKDGLNSLRVTLTRGCRFNSLLFQISVPSQHSTATTYAQSAYHTANLAHTALLAHTATLAHTALLAHKANLAHTVLLAFSLFGLLTPSQVRRVRRYRCNPVQHLHIRCQRHASWLTVVPDSASPLAHTARNWTD